MTITLKNHSSLIKKWLVSLPINMKFLNQEIPFQIIIKNLCFRDQLKIWPILIVIFLNSIYTLRKLVKYQSIIIKLSNILSKISIFLIIRETKDMNLYKKFKIILISTLQRRIKVNHYLYSELLMLSF